GFRGHKLSLANHGRSPCASPSTSGPLLRQCYTDAMDETGIPTRDSQPAFDAAANGAIQITVPVGLLQCNCTIIGDPVSREAIVIDPGDEVSRILELLGRHRLVTKAIVSTHAHIDHVGGLAKLQRFTGAPVLMHREDLPLYQAMDMQAAFLGVAPPDV